MADGFFEYSTARKLKCDGVRPTCTNCLRRKQGECEFDPFPRRRGPAKHKQLKLDAESEPSWPLLRDVPRTRARVAAEAKILTQPFVVGAGAGAGASRSASIGLSEASLAGAGAGGSDGARPSATSTLFGGERVQHEAGATTASPAALSTRESFPSVDEAEAGVYEDDLGQIEEPWVPRKQAKNEEEEARKSSVEDEEEREVKKARKEEVRDGKAGLPKKEKVPKKEEKKEAWFKLEGDEEKLDMLKAGTPESSSSNHLPGSHT